MQVDSEWRTGHRLQASLSPTAALNVDGAAAVQPRDETHVVGIRKQNLAHGIDRDPAPIEYAVVSWIDERTLLRRRRENPFVAQPLEDDSAGKLIKWRAAPHVALAN